MPIYFPFGFFLTFSKKTLKFHKNLKAFPSMCVCEFYGKYEENFK